MVMKKNAMHKNVRQSIRRSFGRYIAIAMIIALGAGVFIGLLMTKTDMVATGQSFTDQQNMFDLRALGSYGWTDAYVDAFRQLDGIEDAEGLISLDAIARTGASGEDLAYRFYSIPETVNKVALREGRMPQAPNECLADGFHAQKYYLGRTVTLSGEVNEQSTLDMFREKEFTIVGLVASPLYMDMNRGNTSIGSGALESYYYVPRDAFDMDYYTEIDLTLSGDYAIYTDAYRDALENAIDELEPEAEKLNQQRFRDAKNTAMREYNDGYVEYCDGLRAYREGKQEAQEELSNAEQTLKDSQQELEENRKKLEDGQKQIESGWAQLRSAKAQLAAGQEELAQKQAEASVQMATAREKLDQSKQLLSPMYQLAVAAKPSAQKRVEDLRAQLDALDPDNPVDAVLAESLQRQLSQAEELLNGFQETIDAMAAIDAGYQQLSDGQAQLDAAHAQLNDAQSQITANEARLRASEKETREGWKQLEEGEKKLEEGWAEYETAKAETEEELRKAEQELRDAQKELADGKKAIAEMEDTTLYLLDRNSNVGFSNLDSNSDIVAGVSRVFPVFFLLVASLVCITTMTRMIDEERTQIGTLKALGYSNGAIIGKYMVYSGSGALLGCSLGILAGCTLFPQVIWKAYCMMLYIQPNVVLTVDWPLCFAVVLMYTAVMLLVTWYCCHKTLEEEPASLIRPKAPDAGKKILLEKMPFWGRISFLNKVTIRNIFRYRQRLAMMLVGIGGCTALLVTGFGLRDSIVNVMDFQFDNVTHYDLNVYFQEENTPQEQEAFQSAAGAEAEQTLFYHQSSVELRYGDKVKQIYMLSAGDALTDFVTLRSGEDPVSMPGPNETVLSIGVAKSLGIRVGDRITLRDSDLETLELTVSGIYENHVYNYAIVSPETIADQWGEKPENQMAFIRAAQGSDPYRISAGIAGLDNVAAVVVSDDMIKSVRGMLDALDLVVLLIIFCAGLLAVTVSYNLTNININERIREIATIKVLGFNSSETAAYVFKENLALTVAGALLGLALGKLLLIFVMSQIQIDMIWFKAVATPLAYLLSIALTLLAAVAVDVVFSKKLEQINMAEALKSVE